MYAFLVYAGSAECLATEEPHTPEMHLDRLQSIWRFLKDMPGARARYSHLSLSLSLSLLSLSPPLSLMGLVGTLGLKMQHDLEGDPPAPNQATNQPNAYVQEPGPQTSH